MPSSLVAYPSEEVPLRSCARYSITYWPSFLTTDGLNTPADSNPSPRGDKIASGKSRVHFPKGGLNETDAAAVSATIDIRLARTGQIARIVSCDILFTVRAGL